MTRLGMIWILVGSVNYVYDYLGKKSIREHKLNEVIKLVDGQLAEIFMK